MPAVVLTVGALLGAAGCGGSSPSGNAQSKSSTSAKASAKASPSMNEPNVGDRALKLGETRKGTGLDTTVLEFKSFQEARPPDSLSDLSEAEGALVRVKECGHDDAEAFEASNFDFTLEDEQGGTYEPSSSYWDDWPTRPQMPASKQVQPGGCATGWILMSVPVDVTIAKVVFASNAGDGTVAAEWILE